MSIVTRATRNTAGRHSSGFSRDASGMTLVEVIVAVVIMGIIATAATGLAITSLNSTATQQRQQLAVTVANQAMETVSAHQAATNPLTGESYLLDGRSEEDAKQSWIENPAVPGINTTYPSWDTRAALPPIAIPFVKIVERAGTSYTVHTLIGTCYQEKEITAGSDHQCTRIGGHDSGESAATQEASAALTRVIINVEWTAGASCAAGCNYQATSLFDPHADLEWNTNDRAQG